MLSDIAAGIVLAIATLLFGVALWLALVALLWLGYQVNQLRRWYRRRGLPAATWSPAEDWILRDLERSGHVTITAGRYQITTAGRQLLEQGRPNLT